MQRDAGDMEIHVQPGPQRTHLGRIARGQPALFRHHDGIDPGPGIEHVVDHEPDDNEIRPVLQAEVLEQHPLGLREVTVDPRFDDLNRRVIFRRAR